MREAYQRFRDRGLEVVGVSLDAVNRVPAATVERFVREHELPWEHVYADGPRIAAAWGVAAIPAAFLVDGDSGAILARGEELSGPALLRTIARKLDEK